MSSNEFWNQKYSGTSEFQKINQPSEFVQFASSFFPHNGRVLELGAGTGQDTAYLLDHGFHVVATDLSPVAIKHLRDILGENQSLQAMVLNVEEGFNFPDNSFEVVLANLVIHYFDDTTTQRVYREIARVLTPKGILAVMVNSGSDPEYLEGEKLDNGLIRTTERVLKRFFTTETLRPFVSHFGTLVLDNNGSDSRRNHKETLIRFIGEKPE